jgi:annexin A7/11
MMGKLKGMATKFLADRKGSNDPAVAGDGTVAADIAALKAAMKGFGSDDEKIINIIFRRPREHLQKLIQADGMLMTRLKMETSGVLQEMIEAAFETHAESRAQWLAKGMHSAGTDEECVVDCLGTATPSEIQPAREAYAKTGLTTRVLSLDFRIKFETGGLLQDVFEAVLSETRPESGVEDAHLAADVEAFHAATAGKFGTDEKAVRFLFLLLFWIKSETTLQTRSFPLWRTVLAIISAR